MNKAGLKQAHILIVAPFVALVVAAVTWISLIWTIPIDRPNATFLGLATAQIIPSLIMIFAWLRTHREITTKGFRIGSFGWLIVGSILAWWPLGLMLGFRPFAGDGGALIAPGLLTHIQLYFYGGWGLAWLLYAANMAKHSKGQ